MNLLAIQTLQNKKGRVNILLALISTAGFIALLGY